LPQQGHPLVQFQAGQQAMYSQQQQQQQMMQKMRMSGGGSDQIIPPGQNMVEGSASMMAPRFGGIPGAQTRFPNPTIIAQHDENAQHLHQQQILQQQQMQRMALMRQAQPANAGVMNQIERIPVQQKWPRQPMDASNFVVDQQGHQYYASHGAHQGTGSGEDPQTMHQVVQSQMPQVQQGIPLAPAQNQPPQHYNQAMVNRFTTPLNPQQQQQQQQHHQQQQQLLFQHMQQQQQASNRFSTSAPQESTSIAGISPFALQQGILNADMQADNPPLVHPSLQGIPSKGKSTATFMTHNDLD